MEIKVIEKTKKRLKLEIKGEDHTFCNILRKELNKDKNIKIAEYNIKSALISSPILLVETQTGTPIKALTDAVKRLSKQCTTFSNKFKQAL